MTGTVQGVGFRPFVFNLATSLGLAGSVVNAGGGVRCIVEGPRPACEEFVRRVASDAPPLAVVRELTAVPGPPHGVTGFVISGSVAAVGEWSSAVPPDIATCSRCRAEAADPTDRRHRYPFICCTECGPRFTVVRDLPYDRATTSMADFPLCGSCRAEFDDPLDRRFHAQATSCPVCGPALGETSIDQTISALRDDAIVAVKGLGGYQLLCRADRSPVVQRLRDLKHRDRKPFALLVDSLETAAGLAQIDDVARAALASPAAPIVLAKALPANDLAPEVAPGTRLLGLMLPATQLHQLIASGVGVPVVCTSGNRSNEPIIIDDDLARSAFAAVADLVVSHDRTIERRADDSVGQVVGGTFQLLRRARGYAPRAVGLSSSGPTVLGVGAELKSTTCLAVDDRASLSVHLGDLESPATMAAFEETIADQISFVGADVALVVHDLHPEYLSTKFALGQDIAPTHAVQHHHAHLVSCLVENGHDGEDVGPAIGVVLDGLGWGDDGTAWGGEFLIGDASGFERAAFLDPVPMPGGVRAIREPWRMAVSHCVEAFGEVPSSVRQPIAAGASAADRPGPDRIGPDRLGPDRPSPDRIDLVAGLCRSPEVLSTSSMGRLFDAVAALCGLAPTVSYEGEAAIALEGLAADGRRDGGAYHWTGTSPVAVVRSVVDDLTAGVDRRVVAHRFHASVAEFVVATCVGLGERTGLAVVALSGGVFQNRLLTELVVPRLETEGFSVLCQREVPPNDGGISLGQVAIGRAHLAGRR